MEGKKPVLQYLLFTVILLLVIIFLGIKLKNYLGERYHNENAEVEKEIPKYEQDEGSEEERLAKLIWGLGALLFAILVIVYIIYKLAIKQIKS